MMYDLLIKNGQLVTGEAIEIGVKAGKIVTIAETIEGEALNTLQLDEQSYVSAGWIDGHVHCFEKMSLYYDFPDQVGVSKGVTTIIDAGSTGAKNIGDFFEIAQQAKTTVLALLNISDWGIIKQDELADIKGIDSEAIGTILQQYPDFIVGLKARMSKTVVGENDIEPLKLAKKIQKENGGIPLMVHIGSAPPTLLDVLNCLEAGDIITHCFNGKENGILASDDTIKTFVWEAYDKGVVFDIGHGTDSFNFHVAEIALQEKMKATTISTDIYHRNRETGPVHDLATTLEKLLEIGYTLEELIKKVTIEPATSFHLPHKGRLEVGCDADVTIFKQIEKPKELEDSNGNKRITPTQIVPQKVVVEGRIYDVNELSKI